MVSRMHKNRTLGVVRRSLIIGRKNDKDTIFGQRAVNYDAIVALRKKEQSEKGPSYRAWGK